MTTEIDSPEVIALRSEGSGFVEMARDLTVTDATLNDATDLLSWIASNKKKLEEQRTYLVKPLNDHVRSINEKFKKWVEPLDEADRTLREKVLAFKAEQRRQEEEARKAAEEERRKHEEERVAAESAGQPYEPPPQPASEPAVPPRPNTTHASLGAMTDRKVWDFEIERPELVPGAFKVVNEKAVRAAVNAGTREIPGVRIFQREDISIRAR